MARRVFYSFHYARDSHRVSQVRNLDVVEGQPLLASNEWRQIEAYGDTSVKTWVDEQMRDKSCLVVLIGKDTADRRRVRDEITTAWNTGKGVMGVYIHGLTNLAREQDSQGANPFATITVGVDKTPMSSIVKAYNPPYTTSANVYDHIKRNLEQWVEDAIAIRTSR